MKVSAVQYSTVRDGREGLMRLEMIERKGRAVASLLLY